MHESCLRAIAAYFPRESHATRTAAGGVPTQQQQPSCTDATTTSRVSLAFIAAHPVARIVTEQQHDGCRVGDVHTCIRYVDGSSSSSSSSYSDHNKDRGAVHALWCNALYNNNNNTCDKEDCTWCSCCCDCKRDSDGCYYDDDDIDSNDDDNNNNNDDDNAGGGRVRRMRDRVVTGGVVRMLSLRGVAYTHALPHSAWWLRRTPTLPLAVTLRGVRGACVLDCATLLPLLTRLCVHASVLMTHLRFAPAAPATLRYVHIESNMLEDVSALAVCGSVRALRLDCPGVSSLDAFAHHHHTHHYTETQPLQPPPPPPHVPVLRVLDVRNCTDLSRVRVLAQLPRLRSLAIATAALDGVALVAACGAGRLRTLRLFGRGASVASSDWHALGALRELRTLQLHGCALPSLSWLRTCTRVRHAVLRECVLGDGDDYSAVAGARGELRTLLLHDRTTHGSVAWLQHNAQLNVLKLHGSPNVRDLHAIGALRYLTVLWFASHDLQDLSWLSECVCLTELRVCGCPRVHDVRALAALRRLRTLTLTDTAVADLTSVAQCRALTDVEVALCPRLRDLSPLGALTQLRRLYLPGSSTATIDWMVHCRALEEVVLESCMYLRDLSPLQTLPRLRLVNTLFCPAIAAAAATTTLHHDPAADGATS